MKITHEQFALQVTDLLHLYGYMVGRFRPAQTSHGWRTPVGADGKGFPDLTAVREETDFQSGRLLFIELKIPPDKPKPEQREWLRKLAGSGKCEAYVFTPDDFEKMAEIFLEEIKCPTKQTGEK